MCQCQVFALGVAECLLLESLEEENEVSWEGAHAIRMVKWPMSSLYGPNQLTQRGNLPNTDCFGVDSMTPSVFHDDREKRARSLSIGLARLNRMVRFRQRKQCNEKHQI